MDWMKQTQDTITSWTETQQRLVEQWLNGLQNYEAQQAGEVWRQTLAVYEDSVHRTLQAQSAWLTSMMDQIKHAEAAPDVVRQQAAQGEALAKNWTGMQRQLFQTWFDVMKEFDPSRVSSSWEQMATSWEREARRMFEAWRSTMQAMLEQNQRLYSQTMSNAQEVAGQATRSATRTAQATTDAAKETTAQAAAMADKLAAMTREELYEMAQDEDIQGRSQMSKEELVEALRRKRGLS